MKNIYNVIMTSMFTIFLICLSFLAKAQTWTGIGGNNMSVGNIIYTKCANCHHAGAIGTQESGIDLSNTSQITATTDTGQIKNAVVGHMMPPWIPNPLYKHFSGERILDSMEIQAIEDWVNVYGGAMNSTTPTPPTFTNGSQLTSSDIITLQHPTYTTVNTGDDEYRNFAFANTLTTAIYITKVEFLIPNGPNDAHVHHIAIFKDQSGNHQSITEDNNDPDPGYNESSPGSIGNFNYSFIYSWVPGSGILTLPCGMGIKLDTSENLVLQFHYPETSGLADSTVVNIEYTTSVSREVFSTVLVGGGVGSNDWFTDSTGAHLTQSNVDGLILPYTGNYQDIYRNNFIASLPDLSTTSDISVFGVLPHMHLAGRNIEMYAADTINSTPTELINITDDKWDLHWQETYIMQQPVKVLHDQHLFIHAQYFNDTGDTVIGGLNTTNEMLVGVIIWSPYQSGDESMVLDPTLSTYVQADAGGPYTQHACSAIQIGGSPAGSNGVSPLSYTWSTADGEFVDFTTSSTSANPYVNIINHNGTYILTVTDAKGCYAQDTVVVASSGTGFLQILDGKRNDAKARMVADVAVDNNGNVYGTGWFNKDIYFARPDNYVVDTTSEETFLVEYSPDSCGQIFSVLHGGLFAVGVRNALWSGNAAHPYSGNLAIDNTNHVYSATHAKLSSGGQYSVIVSKDSTSPGLGTMWYAIKANLVVTDMEADESGAIYMTGFNNDSLNGNISMDMHSGGTQNIPGGEIFIAKINTSDNSLKCDWLTTPGWTAATDGAPSIESNKDSITGAVSLFFNSTKYVATFNSSGTLLNSLNTGIVPGKTSRLCVNSNTYNIYTVVRDTLRIYPYNSSTFAISAASYIVRTPGAMDIAGDYKSPYVYIVTDTGLEYHNVNTGALVNRLDYLSPHNSAQDRSVFVDRTNQKVYMGGDFDGGSTISMNGYSYTDPYMGSFITRADWGSAIYAKNDGGEDEATSGAPAPLHSTTGGSALYLDIFPNPATEQLSINTNYKAGTLFMVYNLLGGLVDKFTIDGNGDTYQLNIGRYNRGVYILKANSIDAGQKAYRFVKE